jgi:hypothetical protein
MRNAENDTWQKQVQLRRTEEPWATMRWLATSWAVLVSSS